jgi:phospholipid-binding lipoprotein MlaA
MRIKIKPLFAMACITLLLTGCASIRNPQDPQDPYQKINKKIFAFNEKLDKDLFEPIAKGYAKIVPAPARTGINNFFQNVDQPSVVANDLLQGDFVHAMADSWRFFINSTFGLFGVFDVAGKMNVPIPVHKNDLGLTLAQLGLNYPK